jgi:methylenetetrahydrofolate reductase (NADPH)
MTGTPDFSFEFFPPKDEKGAVGLWDTIQKLQPLNPQFVSVTYGAAGTTRDRTEQAVLRIHRETKLRPAAHLTCVGATRADIDALAQSWWDSGIRNLVALRGDPPTDTGMAIAQPDGYQNAAHLVTGLRRIADFDIAVAAYPEIHPESKNRQADLDNLKRKVDAGASKAITQFFFDADTFLRFRDIAEKAGIEVPIIPGIMPVTNFGRAVSFAQQCGASIPPWFAELYDGLDDDPETRGLVAAAQSTELCQRLITEGVTAFHFYTLNRPALTTAICRRLRLHSGERKAA